MCFEHMPLPPIGARVSLFQSCRDVTIVNYGAGSAGQHAAVLEDDGATGLVHVAWLYGLEDISKA